MDRMHWAKEPTIEQFKAMAKEIGEGRAKMTQAFENENKVKAEVLEEIRKAVEPALPFISSKLPFGAPYDTGIELLSRKGEKLYIAEEGFFFTCDQDGIQSASPVSIMRDRWSLKELVLAIAEEMQANLDGQRGKVNDVERNTRTVAAVAELLKGTR